MPTEVIIPTTPVVHLKEDEVISKPKEENSSIDVEHKKIKQDDLETPTSPGSLNPPPPYSKWDELSIEQLLEKSREVFTEHTEYFDNGGDKKEKDGEVLDKVSHPVRVRAKFYPYLCGGDF